MLVNALRNHLAYSDRNSALVSLHARAKNSFYLDPGNSGGTNR